MTQDERRVWLIRQLQKEMPEYAKIPVPDDREQQWHLLRGLFNVRLPGETTEEFQQVEGEFLREMTREKGIVNSDALTPVRLDSRILLWQGDITRLKADAIVNAANSGMTGCYQPNHSCIDNAEHTMAGTQMRLECSRIMEEQGHEEPTGQAKITRGYNLPARYVLHTVGPIVMGPLRQLHREQLASCYRSCLDLAEEKRLHSVAFCCISTGVFRFPKDQAAEIAVKTVQDWLNRHPAAAVQRVIFNVYEDSDRKIYDSLLNGRIRKK